MTAHPHRPTRTLTVAQLATVCVYVGATLLPYLFYYAIPGRQLNRPDVPNLTPSELLPTTAGGESTLGRLFHLVVNPVNWLAIAGFWVTMVSVLLTGALALIGASVAATRWRTLAARTRGWLVAGTVLCAALAAFQVSPLGLMLADWVLD